MATKTFDIIVLRHGEGFHNLGTYTKNDLEFTSDDRPKTINSSLTEKGLLQANLVAERLKDTVFDLAITSDLKRATQTAEAIKKKNDSIKELVTWRLVRERCLGDFEGVQEGWCLHMGYSWMSCITLYQMENMESHSLWKCLDIRTLE